MERLIQKLNPKENAVIKWNTQLGRTTTNLKVKIDFTLPDLNDMNVVTWNFHVDDSSKGRYDMILGRDPLPYLGLNLKLSDHFVEADNRTLKGIMHPWLIWVLMNLNI